MAEGLDHRAALQRAPQHTRAIEGRAINARDVHRMMWVSERKHAYSTEIDRIAWSRVRCVERGCVGVAVYNIYVEEDES